MRDVHLATGPTRKNQRRPAPPNERLGRLTLREYGPLIPAGKSTQYIALSGSETSQRHVVGNKMARYGLATH
jgi:hypothetical protein